jgi:hypothetical protein
LYHSTYTRLAAYNCDHYLSFYHPFHHPFHLFFSECATVEEVTTRLRLNYDFDTLQTEGDKATFIATLESQLNAAVEEK